MKGWLYKKHHSFFKGADKRWFEVRKNELRYFETASSVVANRVINLHQATWQDGTRTAVRLNFTLLTPHDPSASVYHFYSHSATEYDSWKEAIVAASSLPASSRTEEDASDDRLELVALVNAKSGGKQGANLIKILKKHMGEDNVVDIMSPLPQDPTKILAPKGALAQHADKPANTRFIVCGGDGTVGWALQDLQGLRDSGEMGKDVAISVLPLGTGNDMARTLGAGGGYGGENMLRVLTKCAQGHIHHLDRWTVDVTVKTSSGAHIDKHFVMCNYFSIGWDAMIARRFHCHRERKPHLYTKRIINKAWYVYYSLCHMFGNLQLSNGLVVEVDEQTITIPPGTVGIAVINIPSYSGGTNLWGSEASDKFSAQRTDDQRLELVGYAGPLHMLGRRMNLRKLFRLGQGKEITIRTKPKDEGGPDPATGICCQVDGEPYLVDTAGIHSDASKGHRSGGSAGGPPASPSIIDMTVKIRHLAVATLVAQSASAGFCTCATPQVEQDAPSGHTRNTQRAAV